MTTTKFAHKKYVHQKLKQNKSGFLKYELVKKNQKLYKSTTINLKKYANTIEVLIIQDQLLKFLLSKIILVSF